MEELGLKQQRKDKHFYEKKKKKKLDRYPLQEKYFMQLTTKIKRKKKLSISSFGEDTNKGSPYTLILGNVNWKNHFGNLFHGIS